MGSGTADAVPTIFDVIGSFASLPAGSNSLTGTISIDLATGEVTGLDLDVPGFDPGFYNVVNVEANGDDVEVDATNGGNVTTFQLVTVFTGTITSGSFMNYPGGAISTGFITNLATSQVVAFGGTATVTPAAVPEPATFALLGAGLAGIGFARRRTLN